MSPLPLRIDPLPPIPAGLPGDPITGNTGGSGGGGQAGTSLQLSYYGYDHLGNTRMVFHTVLKAGEEDPTYVPEYLADYYPYGKILREWLNCTGERYLTTQHERDIETGYDYRGARFYDSDLGRFLSVDPLAAEYAGWSTYNYVLGNPVRLVDPDGRSVEATYKVDREGMITKVDDKRHYDDQGNEVDLLVAGDQVDYNKNGEVKQPHVDVQKGALRGARKVTLSASDGSGQASGTLIGFGTNEKSAREAFEFLANNTDVEWSIFKDESLSGAERTQLTTSHLPANETLGASLATDSPETLFYYDHSHPTRRIMNDDSRLDASDADKAFASKIRAGNSSVRLRVYFSGVYKEY